MTHLMILGPLQHASKLVHLYAEKQSPKSRFCVPAARACDAVTERRESVTLRRTGLPGLGKPTALPLVEKAVALSIPIVEDVRCRPPNVMTARKWRICR